MISKSAKPPNPTRTVYPSGREVLYTVDDANRITSIRLKDGAVITNLLTAMTYVPNGPLKSALYGDGYTQTRTYDLSYRLTGIKDALGATRLRDVTMGYEGRDNLTSITDLLTPANTEGFTYTPRESLSGATGPYGALAYTYDGVGNRLTAKLGTATDTYTYPATSNRLSGITLAVGGTRGFTYDASGNVIAEVRTGGTYSYTYNAAGRMSEFKINGVLQASYKYDAMGRQAIRTLTSPTAVTIHSVFDSDGRRIAEYNETTGALIREYVWHGWDPIAVIEGGVISFVRADHIGRPVFATDATGVKVCSATYNPFGGVHTSTGTLPTARFPGQWFQSESGLHQNWMRDYDPTTGRYLQADPLGLIDGASVYGYAGQSPMMLADPTGECAGPLAYACAAAAGAAWGVGIGFVIDMTLGDGCYTWEELKRDALWGAAGGVVFKGASAAWGAWRGMPTAAGAAAATRNGVAAASAAAARGNSKALAKALAAAGASRGAHEAAHHIVASGAKAAAPAREALKRAGVGIDEAANGMFLPQAFHQSMHTNAYYRAVNDALRGVSTRSEALDVLSGLAQWIRSGGL